jgi:hypothetical protein
MVFYHSQVLVDKIIVLTGYFPQRQNVAEMPFDTKIADKVEEFKILLDK